MMNKNNGQVMIEFTFSMIVLFVMLYGMTHVFQWSGINPVKRQQAHENLMTPASPVRTNPSSIYDSGVIEQLEPNFYTHTGMNAILRDAL